MSLKEARPALGRSDSGSNADQREHKAAFDAYVRKGESAGLLALERKAMSVGSNPDGGYLAPPEIEREIGKRLSVISPIRSIAGIREISATVYKKPFMTAGPAIGWVGETAARPQTDTPVRAELSFPAMELYVIAVFATLMLSASLVSVADAQRRCVNLGDEEANSAYPSYMICHR